jgi:hypothetical protein
VRIALGNGQRPTAAIMHDPYAGHRNYADPFWVPDPQRHTQWTDWDYALMEAVTVLDGLTDPISGQPSWLAEDPGVMWELGHRVNYAAKDLADAAKETESEPWVSAYLKNPSKAGDFWTIDEYLQNLENDSKPMERGAPGGGHVPEPEDNIERKRRAEERIRQAYLDAQAEE